MEMRDKLRVFQDADSQEFEEFAHRIMGRLSQAQADTRGALSALSIQEDDLIAELAVFLARRAPK